jgi:hypothetical protein
MTYIKWRVTVSAKLQLDQIAADLKDRLIAARASPARKPARIRQAARA